MYLKRKVDFFLEEWKADKNRKPLIIKGSRQIGKTESILHFAKEHYESIIEVNFVRDEKYKGIIADGYEAADIIKNISLIDPSKKFVPGKTLIFFDDKSDRLFIFSGNSSKIILILVKLSFNLASHNFKCIIFFLNLFIIFFS